MKNMEAQIKHRIGKDSKTMWEITQVFPYAYRTDYRNVVIRMQESGELIRTWDNNGEVYYRLPTADYLKSYGWTGKKVNGTVLYTYPLIAGTYTMAEAVKIQNERTAHPAQPDYPMVEGEGAPQYTFDVPNETQLALF